MTVRGLVAGLPRRIARDLALLCFLALIIYPVLWPEAPLRTGDSAQYLDVASDLADLRLEKMHVRSAGYPLVLALTNLTPNPPRSTFILQMVLHVASVWLLAVALHVAGGNRWMVVLFGAVLLLPPFVEPAGHLMTENLAQLTLAIGLTSLVVWLTKGRAWLLCMASAALACSAVTRPTYQLLAPALAAGLALMAGSHRHFGLPIRRAVLAGVILVCGTGFVVGGISLANYRSFGYFGMVSTTGYHLSTRTMNLWERLPDEYAQVRDVLLRARDTERTRRGGMHSGTQTIWQARAELLAATGMSSEELSEYLVGMNLYLIRRAPIEYLREVAQSTVLYWFPPAEDLATMDRAVLRWGWTLLHGVLVGLFVLQLVVFVGLRVFAWSRRVAGFPECSATLVISPGQAAVYLLAGTIVFYTMILSCALDIGEVRQRRSTDVLVVLMVFVGARFWWSSIRRPLTAASTAPPPYQS